MRVAGIGFLLGLLVSNLGFAWDLLLWKPGPGYPSFILPSVPGMEPRDVVERYVKQLRENPGLSKVRDGKTAFPIGEVSRFKPSESNAGARFIVLSNRFVHMRERESGTNAMTEMNRVSKRLRTAGAETFVLPLVSDIVLPEAHREEYRKEIARTFDAMLALGGPDWHPETYGKPVTHSNTGIMSLLRDRSELSMMRSYIEAEKGVFYGICRGEQGCGIAQGGVLIQDIHKETAITADHKDTWHEIKVKKNSLLHRWTGRESFYVNSYHHQAVVTNDSLPIVVIAKSTDEAEQLVEAFEFKNKLGAAFQFHPEYMDTKAGRQIMTGMVRHAESVKAARNCPSGLAPELTLILSGK